MRPVYINVTAITTLRSACCVVLLAIGMSFVTPVVAADCRVLDAELQGEYAGPCVDGLAHGTGTAKGSARYTGAFVAGRKHGNGTKEWPNGDRYEGGFANDLKQGYGTYIWGRNSKWAGQRYAGAYAHDRRHGAGVYTWPDGRELAGQWRDDQPPAALPPEMQATVRAHAERMVALSHPGAKVCRNVPVGIVQVDVVRGTVLAMTGGQVRIRIESVGTFSNQMDGRVIAKGDELLVEPDDWFPCR